MAYTDATVIIAADDQSAAQADFPGSFVSGFADPAGAVFYVCSGLYCIEYKIGLLGLASFSNEAICKFSK